MKILFLDESGDHNLAVIDPQYPLFVPGKPCKEDSEMSAPSCAAAGQAWWRATGWWVLPK